MASHRIVTGKSCALKLHARMLPVETKDRDRASSSKSLLSTPPTLPLSWFLPDFRRPLLCKISCSADVVTGVRGHELVVPGRKSLAIQYKTLSGFGAGGWWPSVTPSKERSTTCTNRCIVAISSFLLALVGEPGRGDWQCGL